MSNAPKPPLLTAADAKNMADHFEQFYPPGTSPVPQLRAIASGAAVVVPAVEQEALRRDAERYRWLRERDLDTISKGGVFAGLTTGKGHGGMVLNGADLDAAIGSEK